MSGRLDAALRAETNLPLRLEPDAVDAPDLNSAIVWLADRHDAINAAVLHHGAVLLRGFAITDADEFARLTDNFPAFSLSYAGGATPRSAIDGRVYEASRVPPQEHTARRARPHGGR